MNRDWMYRRYINGVGGRVINEEFLRGLNLFIEFACNQPTFMSGDQIRCPCRKLCKNKAFKDVNTVRAHLLRYGFKFNYEVWTCHGERSAFVENDALDIVENEYGSSSSSNRDSEVAREVSRKAKKNRLADVDGPGRGLSTHKGGSRSGTFYTAALAKERGVPIAETLLDTFYKMHRVDDEYYTDPKTARIAEEVDQIVAEQSQPLPDGTDPPPVDRNVIYVDKGRVFGLESLCSGTQLLAGTTSHDSSATSPSVLANLPEVRELTSHLQVSQMEQENLQAEIARLRAEAEEIKKQLEDTRKAHEQAEEERRWDKTRQELMWQQLYRRLDDRDGLP